jgi:hypothetical protein
MGQINIFINIEGTKEDAVNYKAKIAELIGDKSKGMDTANLNAMYQEQV